MLSEQELDTAARKLCELRGVDPNEIHPMSKLNVELTAMATAMDKDTAPYTPRTNLELARDEIQEQIQVLDAIRYAREGTVVCSRCERLTDANTAHIHKGEWVGECCWGENLKAKESHA